MGQRKLIACAMWWLSCGSNSGTKPPLGGDLGSVDDLGVSTDSSVSPDQAPDLSGPPAPAYDIHAADRTACTFGAGDGTLKTVGPSVPHGDQLPFKHIIVFMKENRSFDSYFSELPAYGVTDVDVPSPTASNPDPSNNNMAVQRFHETRYCVADTSHAWDAVHIQYDNGMMDGFVKASNPGGARAMGYYTNADLPYYYWLAKTFTISDRYFSSLLGPTFANRFFFYGASSWGATTTPAIPPGGVTKILDLLDHAHRSWRIYHDGLVSFGLTFGIQYAGSPISQFATDVQNDKLADLTIIDPNFIGTGQNDEHSPTNIQFGEAATAKVIAALAANQAVWQKSVLFLTYDEHGGLYDHVPPPAACIADDKKPPNFMFDRLGIRVPLIVISPYAKAGFVGHTVADHTSLTRFIENRFDLPAMTHRDANAWPMLDLFDFDHPPFMNFPSGAPSAAASQPGLDWCKNNPPGTGKP